MPMPDYSKTHVWVGAATVGLDERQAKRAVLRHSVRIPRELKIDVLEVYCFAGETRFITRDGVKRLDECVGTTQMVLTQHFGEHDRTRSRVDGQWASAMISSFGEQELLSVHLVRNGARKTIRATPGHRWMAAYSKPGVIETRDLKPETVLASLTPQAGPHQQTMPLHWRVEAVEDLGEVEEVFCATVPDTETFALEDFIWTHNCAQCRRPWDDVVDELCEAAKSNEHLRGGPIGQRKKRLHNHNCEALGCPPVLHEEDDGEGGAMSVAG